MNWLKEFNTTGICIPEKHYMADTSLMVKEIANNLVDKGKYFVINRGRQYGKTTTLNLLNRMLSQKYLVIELSFEAVDDYFISLFQFVNGIVLDIADVLHREHVDENIIGKWETPVKEDLPLRQLGRKITELCERMEREVILIVDEVDKSSDNQIFLSFLGLLRDKYLKSVSGKDTTFKSVILAGVYDIKNMRLKLREEEEHKYNSPWNIAVPFELDMSLSTAQIASMLQEYETDYYTGMNIEQLSQELYYYTSGYPFLVSCLCKKIDEQKQEWTIQSVRNAVRDLLKEKNTLFDDVIKNIQNNKDFSDLTEQILLNGAQVTFDIHNPVIDLGVMFGIYTNRQGKVAVSNVIFETLILNYFTTIKFTSAIVRSDYVIKEQYVQAGRLNMEYVLKQFSAFLRAEYRDEDAGFIEQQGRLLFLSFLRPIINGTGHYAVEPQTRQNNRMDIQVFYGNDEFIVELKIWHGVKYEEKGYDQLVDYLEARQVKKGYLLSFCENSKRPQADRIFKHRGHDICEVIVVYREK